MSKMAGETIARCTKCEFSEYDAIGAKYAERILTLVFLVSTLAVKILKIESPSGSHPENSSVIELAK